jgi:hypothetical protein
MTRLRDLEKGRQKNAYREVGEKGGYPEETNLSVGPSAVAWLWCLSKPCNEMQFAAKVVH